MSAPLNTRIEYLDAVRAFALLLGIVFHASLSFMPMYIGWAVMDVSTGSIVPVFLLISHSFRMELFFLIAGFFSHMTFHRKGFRSFVGTRLTRIALPFVVGWLVLRPLIVSSWLMGGESMRGEVDILGSLKTGLLSLGDLPKDLLTGTHLWFLYYLLLITAIVLTLRLLMDLMPGLSLKMGTLADRSMAWLAGSRMSWWLMSLPTALCLWFMSGWGMDTPDKSLVPHWPVLMVYTGFFALGWLLHRKKERLEQLAELSTGRVVLSLCAIVVTVILSSYQASPGHAHIGLIRSGFVYSYSLMMWSLVFLSVGLFKRFFDKPRKSVRLIAEFSYWLYLIHLPIVVYLQVAVAELAIHWSFKLIAVSVLTVGISFLLYDLFVRSTVIGQTLNGRKRERVLFCQRTATKALAGSTASKD